MVYFSPEFESILVTTSQEFIKLHKNMARKIGVNASIMYEAIKTKFIYHRSNNALFENEWYYYTAEDIEWDTGLTRYEQTKAVKMLTELELIESAKMGQNNATHYKLVDNPSGLLLLYAPIKVIGNTSKSTGLQIFKDRFLKIYKGVFKTTGQVISNIIINNNNIEIIFLGDENSMAKQNTFFKMEVKEDKDILVRNIPAREVSAVDKINIAIKDGNWDKVGPQNIAYYFRHLYVKRYEINMLGFNVHDAQETIKKVMEHFSFNSEQMVRNLIIMFDRYHTLGYASDHFKTFDMIALKQEWVLNGLLNNIPRSGKRSQVEYIDKKELADVKEKQKGGVKSDMVF